MVLLSITVVVESDGSPQAHVFEGLVSRGVALFERVRRITRYDLIVVGVTLLMELCHWRVSFEVLKAHAKSRVCLSLPMDQYAALSY